MQIRNTYANVKQGMDHKFLLFFKRSILGGISQTKRHLSIMDRHGSHITIEAIKQVQEFRLKSPCLLIPPMYSSL
jgi:hypothetical protein